MEIQLRNSLLQEAEKRYNDALKFAQRSYQCGQFEQSKQQIRQCTNKLALDINRIGGSHFDQLVAALIVIDAQERMVREMLQIERNRNKDRRSRKEQLEKGISQQQSQYESHIKEIDKPSYKEIQSLVNDYLITLNQNSPKSIKQTNIQNQQILNRASELIQQLKEVVQARAEFQ